MGLFKKSSSKHDSMATASILSSKSNGGPKSPAPSSRTFTGISPSANASLPDLQLPRAPDASREPAAYLRSIYSVRERSKKVYDLARKNQLRHFDVDMSKFGETAAYVVSIIKVLRYCMSQSHGLTLTVVNREITPETTPQFLPTVAGNISKSVDVHAWTSSCNFGPCR